MPSRPVNNVKLGAFVLAGLIFLVIVLYMIGMNRNIFGSNYLLKARFTNVQGLVAGNNVRYAGIETGTVKKITILNDTMIEVSMLIDKHMQSIIRKNATVSIGTEGLVGNKVVNIVPAKEPDSLAVEGDVLLSRKPLDTDEMLQTLSKTNVTVADIAEGLKATIQHLNNSSSFWALLNDRSIPDNLKVSLAQIRAATGNVEIMAGNLAGLVADIKNGKGSLGTILRDSSLAQNLNEALLQINKVGHAADTLAGEVNKLVAGIRYDINNGKGPVNALLNDSTLVIKLNNSLDNIQKGTDGFNQNMEALKHNFLLRGYFRKQGKQQAKETKTQSDASKN